MPPSRTARKAFGDRIRDLRGAKSGRVIADELAAAGEHFSPQAIGAWERGEYAPEKETTITALERVLGAEPGEMLELLGYRSSARAKVEDRVQAIEQRVSSIERTVAEIRQMLASEEG